MTAGPVIRRLVIAAFVVAALFTWACSRSKAPPAAPAFTVPGTPAAVYDAILPEIRDRIARDTKIVRIEGGNGAITMRFSAYLEDHSVRLVEVGLSPTAPETTTVAIISRRFSFVPGRSRDSEDATLETSLATLIGKRAAESRTPSP